MVRLYDFDVILKQEMLAPTFELVLQEGIVEMLGLKKYSNPIQVIVGDQSYKIGFFKGSGCEWKLKIEDWKKVVENHPLKVGDVMKFTCLEKDGKFVYEMSTPMIAYLDEGSRERLYDFAVIVKQEMLAPTFELVLEEGIVEMLGLEKCRNPIQVLIWDQSYMIGFFKGSGGEWKVKNDDWKKVAEEHPLEVEDVMHFTCLQIDGMFVYEMSTPWIAHINESDDD